VKKEKFEPRMTRMAADKITTVSALTIFRVVHDFHRLSLFQDSVMANLRDQLVHRDLSEQIVGAAMLVLNTLGPGMSEKIYENALVIALHERGLRTNQQQGFVVEFHGKQVGLLRPDLIVEDLVIVDTKVVEGFNDDHMAKMLSYLAITKLELALLINFKFARLHWKRVVRTGVPVETGKPGEQNEQNRG
jgi:GxxExxY protein